MSYVVVKLKGSITIGQEARLRERIKSLLDEGRRIIILDFEEVNYMDSSAVGELAAGLTRAKRVGGELVLAGLQPKVRRLLQMMAFLDAFKVFDTAIDAQQALTG